MTLPLAIAINIRLSHGPDDAPFTIGACLVGQWVVLQLLFGGFVAGAGLQLVHHHDIQSGENSPMRFSIQHLFLVMVVVSLVLSVGRATVPHMAMSGGEGPVFIFLAVAAIVVTLPVLLATLMRRKTILGVILALMLVVGATVYELPLMQRLGGNGPNQGHFIAINSCSTLVVLLVAGSLRINGYFLARRNGRVTRPA